jgi:hypothetical protein
MQGPVPREAYAAGSAQKTACRRYFAIRMRSTAATA